MKKATYQTSRLLLLILSLLFSALAKADELYKFAHIICSPELNYFQVSSLNLYDVYSDESMAAKQHRELAEKYQLYSDSIDTAKICH
jgi:hypothetical protein